MASLDTIKSTLRAMGFAPDDGKSGDCSKTYQSYNHILRVSLGKNPADCRIDFGTAQGQRRPNDDAKPLAA